MENVQIEGASINIREIDEYADAASSDSTLFEILLNDYTPFLKAQVSRLAGSWGKQDLYDDMMNDAFMAFYESVNAYDRNKGHFFPFMRAIVHKRLVDSLRKQYTNRVQTVPLETEDEEGSNCQSQIDLMSADAYRESERQRDLVIEIDSYKRELVEWGITMDALVTHSPKHTRLKELCREIINAVAADEEILQVMWTKNYFPVKKISDLTGVPNKTIERVRVFIIGSLIIRAGDYDLLKEYVTDSGAS